MLGLPESPRLSVESDEVSLEPLLHLTRTWLNRAHTNGSVWLRDGAAQIAEDGHALRQALRPIRRSVRKTVQPYQRLLTDCSKALRRPARAFAADFTHELHRMAVTLPPAFQHLAQHGLMATLAAVLRAGVAIRGVPQWPAPALFTAVIVIDFIIAALVGPPSVTQSPNVRAALYAEPKNDSSMAAGWLPAYAQATPRPGSQIEALGRIELAAPTVTPEPVITATPIPQISTAWQSTLPLEPAWNGAGECGSQFVVAPTGGGTLAWPGDNRYLSGRNYYPAWHPGIDIAAQLGDPLYAADSGVVVYSGWNTQGYGNMLIVDHGNGWHTLYAHLSQINVSCNDPVWQGQVIGLAGSTGNSTGPHLHFEVRSPNGRVNPWTVLSP